MNLLFVIICLLLFVIWDDIFANAIIGALVCIFFAIFDKKIQRKFEIFNRIIIVSIILGIWIVKEYLTSKNVCLLNSIYLAVMFNPIMSVYILFNLRLVTLIKDKITKKRVNILTNDNSILVLLRYFLSTLKNKNFFTYKNNNNKEESRENDL